MTGEGKNFEFPEVVASEADLIKNGDLMEAIIAIETQEEADAFWKDLMLYVAKVHEYDVIMGNDTHETQEELEENTRKSIGYMTGYYSEETAKRIQQFFDARHPFFGKIGEDPQPTPEEAFEMGQKYAEDLKKEGKI